MIWRLYFNRFEDFPQMWSVDEGAIDTEINVIGASFVGCPARTVVLPQRDRDGLDLKRHPVAWIQIDGARLHIEKGCAIFSPPTWAP